ncbi:MAG: hypothetical protein MJY97_10175 [Bacteroidales bacterium]|nr:hypothetical protein [Bacteroidales bacterium]
MGLKVVKRVLAAIALITICLTSTAQSQKGGKTWKMPSSLENPASQEIAKRYSGMYKTMRVADAGMFAGLGVTAASTGYMLYHMNGSSFAEAFGGLIVGGVGIVGGLATTAVSTAAYLGMHGNLVRIGEENDFLHSPGNTQDMWDYQHAQKKYAHSKNVMLVSGIATAGLAGCTAAGLMIGNRTGHGDMILVAEAATYLGIASAATFLTSWTINAKAKKTISRLEPLSGLDGISFVPFVAPMQLSTSGNDACPLVTGLAITARF